MSNSIIYDIKQVFRSNNYLYQIIIVNVAIFIALNIVIALTPVSVGDHVMRFFALSADVGSYFWMIWTYFTYMFTHTGFWHIAGNLILLYWMARILADLYGQKRVLELYVYGGLAGGLLFVIGYNLLPGYSTDTPLIGASAGVMSVMVAIGILQPDYRIRLPFFGEVALKYLVLFGFLYSTIIDLNMNTGGKMAHFGGAIYGALFAYYLPKGLDINKPISAFFKNIGSLFTTKPKIKVVHKNHNYQSSRSNPAEDQAQVDVILDKISKSGYDSLNQKEKDFLFKFGK